MTSAARYWIADLASSSSLNDPPKRRLTEERMMVTIVPVGGHYAVLKDGVLAGTVAPGSGNDNSEWGWYPLTGTGWKYPVPVQHALDEALRAVSLSEINTKISTGVCRY